jgi:hypothetical protein
MRKEGDKVTNWQDVLNDNPIPWLLEPDNPLVRYLWTVLEYPYFGYGVISALDALARLGYTLEQPKVALATAWLLSRQWPNGTWPLDQSPRRPPFDVGQPGQPNKWLTLDALRVIKLLH